MRSLRNVNQAAELLGISPWTVRAYIRGGKLMAVRLGRRVLLSEDELERFVTEGQQPLQRDQDAVRAELIEVRHDNA